MMTNITLSAIGRGLVTAGSAWLMLLQGCASTPGGSGSLIDRALDQVGLQTKPSPEELSRAELPAMPKAQRQVTLRIHAGELLNVDDQGRPLALVAKIYRLRDPRPFLQATYPMLAGPGAGKPGIDGIVDVREVVLTPGQRYEAVESVPPEVTHIGVIGMFRTPDEKRWRFAFDLGSAARSGITLGAHGCALSVAEGRPLEAPPESLRLAASDAVESYARAVISERESAVRSIGDEGSATTLR